MLSAGPLTPGTAGTTQGHNNPLAYATSPPPQTFKRPASSSDDEHDDNMAHGGRGTSRRNTVVKRACNECRQQKLKCNVQQDPFVSCARCVKQQLTCVIEPNFKRVGKRTRNAEMEKEMDYLRGRLATYERLHGGLPPKIEPRFTGGVPPAMPPETAPEMPPDDAFLHTQHQQVAATSLLDLRSGSPMMHTLEGVRLSPSQVNELFTEFFDLYHPFLPFLDPTRSPDDVCSKDNKLLFWAIVSVAARHHSRDLGLLQRLKEPLTDLIWTTIKGQTNHHVVKALCLLCYWPLPQHRTVSDPTFMLCGIMMQVALQIGLHRPTHPQDFSRKKVRLQVEDIQDRRRTWAVCNIVAQTVSTGHGQPSITLYDSTLEFKTDDEDHMRIITPDLFVRLRQEMAASRINKLLYSTNSHRFAEGAATAYMNLEADRLKEERKTLDGVNQRLEELHHYAVTLHLHLYCFFNREAHLERRPDLLNLYYAATAFLDRVFELQRDNRLICAPYHIMQMALAAGFGLLKLLNSDFAGRLPSEGRQYVLQTVEALRKSKVETNDLLDRFAEVLAQLWKESSRGRSLHSMSQSPVISNPGMANMFNSQVQQPHQQEQPGHRRDSSSILDDPLGLIIQSRMSMSVVFDCVWRWRESQVSNPGEHLDQIVRDNPTNPDSSSNSTPPPGVVVENPTHGLPNFNPHLNTLSMPLQLPNGLASANSYEFFDSVSWMLEAQNDWQGNQYGGGYSNDFTS
ncbi:Zn(II)2Cys6 transcriptional activator [Massarina eburnea CBS 473.64]|uniref:Zn(II)2Cys6 transcriptional activator n=1 Tax=Massarina eburnea CBS 473.64 TaxID=1395130 RepID=A0A6A6RVL2_9PLEO|nr:Zn(II)2Cys6 transcriptional activator [Massarina eburnea CBS 473.64]